MRTSVVVLLIVAVAHGQVPQDLLDRLKDSVPSVREEAVIRLGLLKPSPEVSSKTVADLLVAAMKDADGGVRANALSAFCRRDDLPSEVVIPVLLSELRRAGSERSPLSRLRWRTGEAETLDQIDFLWVYGSVENVLHALTKQWDDRAVRGLAEVVRGWPLERMPGGAVETACQVLCGWGTRDALDAVVDVLSRGRLLPFVDRLQWEYDHPRRKYIGLLDSDHRDRIGMALVARLAGAGTSPSTSVYEGSKEAWHELLRKEGSRIPVRLPDSRPMSRPTSPSSRPAQAK